MKSIVYITGSFPRLGDGIGDAAGKLYDAIEDKSYINLFTSDNEKIRSFVNEHGYGNVSFVPNWRIGTVIRIIEFLRNHRIQNVLIEYAGNGYKKDISISFLPLILRVYNIFSKSKVTCHLRLHEFTMCRPARKMLTYPLVLFSHHIDTPSYVEYKALTHRYGHKVQKSMIGSNFAWRDSVKQKASNRKIKLAFFGGIYPGKGIEKLIDIWGRLYSKYPDEYEYWLLGGFPKGLTSAFDSYQKDILRIIKEKGMQDVIKITGFLPADEIQLLLDQTDIAVLPYEDGLTLRRGSFLAFLGRQVSIVTSVGDMEAEEVFKNARGVKMCKNDQEMINAILAYSKDGEYFSAGIDNRKFKDLFDWKTIAKNVIGSFDA